MFDPTTKKIIPVPWVQRDLRIADTQVSDAIAAGLMAPATVGKGRKAISFTEYQRTAAHFNGVARKGGSR